MTGLPVDPDLLDDVPPHGPGTARSAPGRPSPGWRVLTAVALGGGGGSLARYGVSQVLPAPTSGFPRDTFVVNLIGCLLIGVLMVVVTDHPGVSWWWRPLLGVGLLGGFTTYSTMMLDLRDLASAREGLVAGCYLVGSVLGGLVAVWVGVGATRRVRRGSGGRGTAGARG